MFDEFDVKVSLLWQRDLEHHQLIGRQFVEACKEGRFEHGLGLGFVRAMNIHFRLDDRHKASRKNLRSHLELLIDDGLYTGAGSGKNDPERDG